MCNSLQESSSEQIENINFATFLLDKRVPFSIRFRIKRRKRMNRRKEFVSLPSSRHRRRQTSLINKTI